jgi:hypothetical protein
MFKIWGKNEKIEKNLFFIKGRPQLDSDKSERVLLWDERERRYSRKQVEISEKWHVDKMKMHFL